MINNFCKKGYERDPLDRLISITEGKEIVVRLTDNQLTQELAKHIKSAFKKVTLKIMHAKEPNDLTEARIRFT